MLTNGLRNNYFRRDMKHAVQKTTKYCHNFPLHRRLKKKSKNLFFLSKFHYQNFTLIIQLYRFRACTKTTFPKLNDGKVRMLFTFHTEHQIPLFFYLAFGNCCLMLLIPKFTFSLSGEKEQIFFCAKVLLLKLFNLKCA